MTNEESTRFKLSWTSCSVTRDRSVIDVDFESTNGAWWTKWITDPKRDAMSRRSVGFSSALDHQVRVIDRGACDFRDLTKKTCYGHHPGGTSKYTSYHLTWPRQATLNKSVSHRRVLGAYMGTRFRICTILNPNWRSDRLNYLKFKFIGS